MESLVTYNRLQNSISKIGKIQNKNQRQKLQKMMKDEVIEILQEWCDDVITTTTTKMKKVKSGGVFLWDKISSEEKNEIEEKLNSLIDTLIENSIK